jgi:hypothetical protein
MGSRLAVEKDGSGIFRLSPEDATSLMDSIEAAEERPESVQPQERIARATERREEGQQALAQIQHTPPKKLAAV